MWNSKRDVIAMLIIAFGLPLLALLASLVTPFIFNIKQGRVGWGWLGLILLVLAVFLFYLLIRRTRKKNSKEKTRD
jgi:uncharacterized membrane protein YbhN (UPF0104 family)